MLNSALFYFILSHVLVFLKQIDPSSQQSGVSDNSGLSMTGLVVSL